MTVELSQWTMGKKPTIITLNLTALLPSISDSSSLDDAVHYSAPPGWEIKGNKYM